MRIPAVTMTVIFDNPRAPTATPWPFSMPVTPVVRSHQTNQTWAPYFTGKAITKPPVKETGYNKSPIFRNSTFFFSNFHVFVFILC